MNMKIKLGIPSTGDSGRHVNYMYTSFLYNTNNKALMRQLYTRIPIGNEWGWGAKNLNNFGERTMNVSRVVGIGQRHKEDPLLFEVVQVVQAQLFPPSKKRYNLVDVNPDFRAFFGWRYDDGTVDLTLYRRKGSFFLDNVKMLKKDAIYALSKILMRSVYTRSAEVLSDYIEKQCDTPHNVLYAIENRTPYHFYENGRKIEVLINTQRISMEDVAVEISENIWADVTTREWNQFLNCFRHSSGRSKRWKSIHPENLWIELFTKNKKKNAEGEYRYPATPTSGQLKLMIAWLKQNRTSQMVEDRASQLLRSLDAEYPQLTFINWPGIEDKALHVRGKVRDWVITGKGGMKIGHQNVSTYCLQSEEKHIGGGKLLLRGRELSGSICIDNLHNNTSVGDQIACRALVLMNDKTAYERVYTIRGLVATDGIIHKNQPRLDMKSLLPIRFTQQQKRRDAKIAREQAKASA